MTDKIQVYGVDSTVVAMTKQEFFALAEKRIRDNAGSGFAEWGKADSAVDRVNEGITCPASLPNEIYMGRSTSRQVGISRTEHAITVVNGVQHAVNGVNSIPSDFSNVELRFPPAPDGTKTYDSATGDVIQHADSAAAFAAETATRKVITSRQDYVFLESWHEKISDKGQVYPLGNVQYGAADYKGITLLTRDDGYTRFGEWDTETTGNYAVWDDLSFEEKAIFLSDPENNIYQDGDDLFQSRYRIRVVEGLGDNWGNYGDSKWNITPASGEYLAYAPTNRVQVRGALTTVTDLAAVYQNGFATGSNETASLINIKGLGQYSMRTDHLDADVAYDGLCFAVPIALVQRRNSGAYHPVYNAQGARFFGKTDNINSQSSWYTAGTGTVPEATSLLSCMTTITEGGVMSEASGTGAIGGLSGRPDDKFYDAIYASDVKDLRMSSRRVTNTWQREHYKRKAIAGEVRGFEGVPFTNVLTPKFNSDNSASTTYGAELDQSLNYVGGHLSIVLNSGTIITANNPIISQSGAVLTVLNPFVRSDYSATGLDVISRPQLHSQANPTWTDVVGDPARIAATFPNGVEGQWIPVIPDGVIDFMPMNRKSLGSDCPAELSDNVGATWVSYTQGINTTLNALTLSNTPATRVGLYHYETQAHFTSADVNSEVIDLGGVFATKVFIDSYALFGSSLIGKVLTNDGSGPKHSSFLPSPKDAYIDALNGLMSTSTSYSPKHGDLDIGAVTGDNPAVKTLDYLSSNNGVGKLCYAYKEMIYDSGKNYDNIISANAGANFQATKGTPFRFSGYNNAAVNGKVFICAVNLNITLVASALDGYTVLPNGKLISASGNDTGYSLWDGNGWGDDNQFQIVNNQESFTDDNGNTGVRGTASFDTQYFIDGSN